MNIPAAGGSPRPDAASPVERQAERVTFNWYVLRAFKLLGRRRRFLLHRREQLRAVFLTGGAASILLALLNVALYLARRRDVAALLTDAPGLREMIVAQTRMETIVAAAASLVFVAGVLVVTLIETHRTAGAAFNLARHMAAVQAGQYDIELRLRKGDNLHELETAFNDMARALRERTLKEAQALDVLAAAAEKLGGPDEAAQLAGTIRERARETRSMAG